LTVLLMLVGASGHIAVRTLGIRYGYVLSAIASGFASSTVTIATMGHRLAREPTNLRILSGALLSNLATMVQTGLILATVDPALLRNMWLPLVCGSVAALIYSACLMFPRPARGTEKTLPIGGAFNLKLALIVALTMTAITLVSSAMLSQFGQVGVMLTATFSGSPMRTRQPPRSPGWPRPVCYRWRRLSLRR
jgi:uncharacterized membrane protein (DUF4010 family)